MICKETSKVMIGSNLKLQKHKGEDVYKGKNISKNESQKLN
jgi:hypothetical protein